MRQVIEGLKQQWTTMLERGGMPLFEIEIIKGDYCLVELRISDHGFIFEFDSLCLSTWFDGDVRQLGPNTFLLPFDEDFDDLDHYIQAIFDNISDGFILANKLPLRAKA